MDGRNTRVGFISNSFPSGSTAEMLVSLSSSIPGDTALFVFSLDAVTPRDRRSMLATDNIDGLISWGLSGEKIFGQASVASVPLITIGAKSGDVPNIEFDSYRAMKTAILHCIRHHQARRIAFIQGEAQNPYALLRYEAYKDCLREADLELLPELVSPPMDWSRGRDAIDVLLNQRELVPGDFDTIVCASDPLMFDVSQRLFEMGVRIPDTVRIIGFNDSKESRALPVPGTTVRIPYANLSRHAWTSIRRLMDEESVPDGLLPADVVIRRSCGCTAEDSFRGRMAGFSREPVIARLVELYHLGKDGGKKFSDLWGRIESLETFPVSGNLQSRDSEYLFSELVNTIVDSGEDIELLHVGLSLLCDAHAGDARNLRKYVNTVLLPLISRIQEQKHNMRLYSLSQRTKKLNLLKSELADVKSYDRLVSVLAGNLPSLDVTGIWLVMYDDQAHSRLIGGFDSAGRLPADMVFSRSELLPVPLMQRMAPAVHSVLPLLLQHTHIGYAIARVSTWDGEVVEEIGRAVNQAVQSVLSDELTRLIYVYRKEGEFLPDTLHKNDGLEQKLEKMLELYGYPDRKAADAVARGRGETENSLFVLYHSTIRKSWEKLFPEAWTVLPLASLEDFPAEAVTLPVRLLFTDNLTAYDVKRLRKNVLGGDIPIMIYGERWDMDAVAALCDLPDLLLCDETLVAAPGFKEHIVSFVEKKNRIPTYTRAKAKRAFSYLRSNSAKGVTRWQVASAVGVSEDYLSAIFKLEFGMTPWDYLSRFRIRSAMRILRTSALSVEEVGMKCGFSEHAYFCRVFKRLAGVSPGVFRQLAESTPDIS